MNLENIYNKNKLNLFGSDSTYMENLRRKLINNFDLDPKKLKNNESTKHFDTKIINNFEYIDNQQAIYNPIFETDVESIISLKDKKDSALDKIKKYENVILNDYLVNLNTIFNNSGNIFKIDNNIDKKIVIRHEINNENTIFSKNFFNIGTNSKVIIIEKFNNNKKSNMNIVNYFEIEKNSDVKHLILMDNKDEANLQYTNYINCYSKAEYKQIIFNSSKSSIRNHNYSNLLGEYANTILKGIFFGNNNQIIDNKTVVNHLAPLCTSDQIYKGILTDNAIASYLSKTYVDKIAQKTEAYQLSKGILLSENSYFHSKPELKIYADDVKCSHGSTIGPFDQNILFYVRSRGVPEKIALSLLINSFFSDIIDNADNKHFVELVDISLNNWLKENNY